MADRSTNLPGQGTEDPSNQKSAFNPSDRLGSWKEIAAYLNREVRTVQRWEKLEGLPVHRHQHDERSSVFAYKAELDAWWHNGHSVLEEESGKEEQPADGTAKDPVSKPPEAYPRPWRNWRLWLPVAAVTVAAAVAIYVLKLWPSPQLPLHPKDFVLIANFENRTGDPVFDGTLRQGLAAQLDQSPVLYIVSDAQIASELRFMKQPTGTQLTQDLARQVCERMGGAAVLDGSIARIGSQYSLVLDAANCATGASVARAQVVARDKSHILPALGSLASTMRKKLGESLSTVLKFDAPIDQVTTPSLEALKAYTLGRRALLAEDYAAAVTSFQHAVALDPNFAMAYANLGAATADNSLVKEYTTKAYSLRDRVSERERFYISSHYHFFVTGDLLKAKQVVKLWAQIYPRDPAAFGDIGSADIRLGQYDEAVAATLHELEIAPDVMNYSNLVACYKSLNRPDEAAAALVQARSRGIDSPVFHLDAAAIAFLRGNTAAVAREEALLAGTPGVDHIALFYRAEGAVFAGGLAEARGFSERAVDTARREGNKDMAANFKSVAAVNEAVAGNVAQASQLAMASLKIADNRRTEAISGLALALAGDATQARKLADDLEKRFPQDTIVQFESLPAIRAAVALDENNPQMAISDLRSASAYELGANSPVNLYPAYVRGLAFLAEHKGAQAAAEFQKIIDHSGIAIAEIIVPLSHLGLARARALEGDKPGARKAYKNFFTLWQHADPAIPILQQAKKEYARLE